MESNETLLRCTFHNPANEDNSNQWIYCLLTNLSSLGKESPSEKNTATLYNDSEWVWLFHAPSESFFEFQLSQCHPNSFQVERTESAEAFHQYFVPKISSDQAVSLELEWDSEFKYEIISVDEILNENEALFDRLPLNNENYDEELAEDIPTDDNGEYLKCAENKDYQSKISPKIKLKITTESLDSICGSSSEIEEILSHQNSKLGINAPSKTSSSDLPSSAEKKSSENISKVDELAEDEVFSLGETEDGQVDADNNLLENVGSIENPKIETIRTTSMTSGSDLVKSRSKVLIAKIHALLGLGGFRSKIQGVKDIDRTLLGNTSNEESLTIDDNPISGNIEIDEDLAQQNTEIKNNTNESDSVKNVEENRFSDLQDDNAIFISHQNSEYNENQITETINESQDCLIINTTPGDKVSDRLMEKISEKDLGTTDKELDILISDNIENDSNTINEENILSNQLRKEESQPISLVTQLLQNENKPNDGFLSNQLIDNNIHQSNIITNTNKNGVENDQEEKEIIKSFPEEDSFIPKNELDYRNEEKNMKSDIQIKDIFNREDIELENKERNGENQINVIGNLAEEVCDQKKMGVNELNDELLTKEITEELEYTVGKNNIIDIINISKHSEQTLLDEVEDVDDFDFLHNKINSKSLIINQDINLSSENKFSREPKETDMESNSVKKLYDQKHSLEENNEGETKGIDPSCSNEESIIMANVNQHTEEIEVNDGIDTELTVEDLKNYSPKEEVKKLLIDSKIGNSLSIAYMTNISEDCCSDFDEISEELCDEKYINNCNKEHLFNENLHYNPKSTEYNTPEETTELISNNLLEETHQDIEINNGTLTKDNKTNEIVAKKAVTKSRISKPFIHISNTHLNYDYETLGLIDSDFSCSTSSTEELFSSHKITSKKYGLCRRQNESLVIENKNSNPNQCDTENQEKENSNRNEGHLQLLDAESNDSSLVTSLSKESVDELTSTDNLYDKSACIATTESSYKAYPNEAVTVSIGTSLQIPTVLPANGIVDNTLKGTVTAANSTMSCVHVEENADHIDRLGNRDCVEINSTDRQPHNDGKTKENVCSINNNNNNRKDIHLNTNVDVISIADSDNYSNREIIDDYQVDEQFPLAVKTSNSSFHDNSLEDFSMLNPMLCFFLNKGSHHLKQHDRQDEDLIFMQQRHCPNKLSFETSISSNQDSAVICDSDLTSDSQSGVGTIVQDESFEEFIFNHPMITSQTVDSLFISALSSNKQTISEENEPSSMSIGNSHEVIYDDTNSSSKRKDSLPKPIRPTGYCSLLIPPRSGMKRSPALDGVCELLNKTDAELKIIQQQTYKLINDDDLYPDSVTPSKADSSLRLEGSLYDFPYMDDDAFCQDYQDNHFKYQVRAKLADFDECTLSSEKDLSITSSPQNPSKQFIITPTTTTTTTVRKKRSRNRFLRFCRCACFS